MKGVKMKNKRLIILLIGAVLVLSGFAVFFFVNNSLTGDVVNNLPRGYKCIDDDNGIYSINGTTRNKTTTLTEYCINETDVAEIGCAARDWRGRWKRVLNSAQYSQMIITPINCEVGGRQFGKEFNACVNGACIEKPLIDCTNNIQGKRVCLNNRKAAVCIYENKKDYWKEVPCSGNCVNGYCSEENVYQCLGEAREGLCYNKGYYDGYGGWQKSYEDANLKIDFVTPNSAKVGDTINIQTSILNKHSNPSYIDYNYQIFSDICEKISSDLLTNDNLGKQMIHLPLAPNEMKSFFTTCKLNAPTVKTIPRGLFGFSFKSSFVDKDLLIFMSNIEPINDYITCNSAKYPSRMPNIGDDSYESSKCCNNLFYPGFVCCADSDCANGKCSDGRCVNKYDKGNALAIGNKEVLFIEISQTNVDVNPCVKKDAHPLLIGVESYYDSMANRYLNRDTDFINFNWSVYGKFNLSILGLTQNEVTLSNGYMKVRDAVVNYCNLSNNQYTNTLFVVPGYSSYWCGGESDCAIKGISFVILSGSKSSTTTAHELAHTFGCSDIYNSLGGNYQWRGELMSAGREKIDSADLPLSSLPGLQVCRGEMGWMDLDGNGIIEVIDWQNQRDI